jgi:hypothetical protein
MMAGKENFGFFAAIIGPLQRFNNCPGTEI